MLRLDVNMCAYFFLTVNDPHEGRRPLNQHRRVLLPAVPLYALVRRFLPLSQKVVSLIMFFEVRCVPFHNLVGFEQEVLSQYSRHDQQEQLCTYHRDVGENDDCL